jgi:hypothetical protein
MLPRVAAGKAWIASEIAAIPGIFEAGLAKKPLIPEGSITAIKMVGLLMDARAQRRSHDQFAARLQNACNFFDHPDGLRAMFEHFRTQDHVEARIGNRDVRRVADVINPAVCAEIQLLALQRLEILRLIEAVPEERPVRTGPRADVQNPGGGRHPGRLPSDPGISVQFIEGEESFGFEKFSQSGNLPYGSCPEDESDLEKFGLFTILFFATVVPLQISY